MPLCGIYLPLAPFSYNYFLSVIRPVVTHSWINSVNVLKYTVPFSASTRSIADSIKPGDIVTTPYVHAGLVIGVNNDYVQVVQESTGINVIVLRKIDGRLPDGSASGFTHFTLLDEFYKVYGK